MIEKPAAGERRRRRASVVGRASIGTASFGHELRRLGYDVYLATCNSLLALPSHVFRVWVLRRLVRADVGRDTAVGRRIRVEGKGGLRIGEGTNVNARVHLDGRGGLAIGSRVNISPEALLLSAGHDPSAPDFAGREAMTVVADRVWIASRAIILPGTHLGEGVVVAAGAVVRGTIPPWTIVAGNPARAIGERPRDAQEHLPPYRRWLG